MKKRLMIPLAVLVFGVTEASATDQITDSVTQAECWGD